VNPVAAWKECILRYQQKEQTLKADPQYQEELRLKKQQLNVQQQQLEQLKRLGEQLNLQQQNQNQRNISTQCASANARRDMTEINLYCRL
jgi:hypothetical protein